MADDLRGARPDQPRPLPLRAAMGGLKRGFAALGVRNYRLYWSGQVVSLIGTWMQQVSLPWLVLVLGGRPIDLGLVAVLQFGPALILAPFGGVVADRVDKRKALIVTQLAAALQASTLFLLILTGVVDIGLVMLMAFWLGVVNAADWPLRQAMVADLVPRHILANAIALNSMAFNSARILGPAVAGVIIAVGQAITGSATAGVGANLAVNALTYSAVLTALVRMDRHQIRQHERPERHPAVLHSLAEGFTYAIRTPLVLWPLVLLAGIAAFGFNFPILLPLFARDVLSLDADGYGALFAALGIGSLAGSLTLAFMRQRRALPLIFVGGLVFAGMLVGISLADGAWVAAPFVIGAGFFSMLMVNTINATVQANVDDALRGRVMSFYVTVFAGSAPLGGLLAGAAAEALGTPATFVAGAILSTATIALVGWGVHRASRRGSLGITLIDSSSRRPTSADLPSEARSVSATR